MKCTMGDHNVSPSPLL